MKVCIKKAFVAAQRARHVAAADAVEYRLMGMHVHLVIPGKLPVVMSRTEFSKLLSDGHLVVL